MHNIALIKYVNDIIIPQICAIVINSFKIIEIYHINEVIDDR